MNKAPTCVLYRCSVFAGGQIWEHKITIGQGQLNSLALGNKIKPLCCNISHDVTTGVPRGKMLIEEKLSHNYDREIVKGLEKVEGEREANSELMTRRNE